MYVSRRSRSADCEDVCTVLIPVPLQYDELSITSRAKHCALPHYRIPMEKGRTPETFTAKAFIRYMRMYAARFDLDVRLGVKVSLLSGVWCKLLMFAVCACTLLLALTLTFDWG